MIHYILFLYESLLIHSQFFLLLHANTLNILIMLFLPVETSGDGEIHALSRVQMALREAHLKAQEEFDVILEKTGKSLDTIRQFVEAYPILRRPFYPIPALAEVAGTAARFVAHVSDLIDGRVSFRKL